MTCEPDAAPNGPLTGQWTAHRLRRSTRADVWIAGTLLALAAAAVMTGRVARGNEPPPPDVQRALDALEGGK